MAVRINAVAKKKQPGNPTKTRYYAGVISNGEVTLDQLAGDLVNYATL